MYDFFRYLCHKKYVLVFSMLWRLAKVGIKASQM